jgi:hypothetical protein
MEFLGNGDKDHGVENKQGDFKEPVVDNVSGVNFVRVRDCALAEDLQNDGDDIGAGDVRFDQQTD